MRGVVLGWLEFVTRSFPFRPTLKKLARSRVIQERTPAATGARDCEIKPQMRNPDENKITIRNDRGKINGWCRGDVRVIVRHTHRITAVAAEKPFGPERRSESRARVPGCRALRRRPCAVGSRRFLVSYVKLVSYLSSYADGRMASEKPSLIALSHAPAYTLTRYDIRWTFARWTRPIYDDVKTKGKLPMRTVSGRSRNRTNH